MRHTQLISEEILHSQSDFCDSRGLLPELIFRLIIASIRNPKDLFFPSGGSIGQRGFDGILNSAVSFDPFIPQGQSFWEIGTGGNPQNKATQDYKKRTDQVNIKDRLETTFIFVTSRSPEYGWYQNKQNDWIKKRKQNNEWKDIRIINGSILKQWLFLFPALDFWLANNFGFTTIGLTTPDQHWKTLKSYGSPPELIPEIFIIAKEKARDLIIDLLHGKINLLKLESKYPEEGIDLISAVLAKLDKDNESGFSGRCLIISDIETWKTYNSLNQHHVLIAKPELDICGTNYHLLREALSNGHSVIFTDTPQNGVQCDSISMNDMKIYQMSNCLESIGYSSLKAYEISEKCNGNISTLKRLLSGISPSPSWCLADDAIILSNAILFGQWDGKNEEDRVIIENCIEKKYEEWIEKILNFAVKANPPLIRHNDKWRFISRYEGWVHLGKFVTKNHYKRFIDEIIKILNYRDPNLDLPKEDRWILHNNISERKYCSSLLREGIAETLAFIGCYPDSLSSISRIELADSCNSIIKGLLRDLDWKLWASLNDYLPSFAEASPDCYLECLDDLIMQDGNETVLSLFAQEGDGLKGQNYMTGLLWSLETLAWSPEYLSHVTLLLGKLTEIDPGGSWSNRPFNSLINIYLPWYIQTSSSIDEKLSAVNILLRESFNVGWKLLLSLLPSYPQSTFGSSKPKWRDFVPNNFNEKPTRIEYSNQIEEYSNLIIQIVASKPLLLLDLIQVLHSLFPTALNKIIDLLTSEIFNCLSENDKSEIWEQLYDLVIKHRKFSDAEWALSSTIIDNIEKAALRFKPDNPQLVHRRLFSEKDTELFETIDDYHEQIKALEIKRYNALLEIIDKQGYDGLIEFVKIADRAYELGLILGKISDNNLNSMLLPTYLTLKDQKEISLINGYILSRFKDGGWSWVNQNKIINWNKEQISTLLSFIPYCKDTFNKVQELLGDDESIYWQKVEIFTFNSVDELIEATEKLLKYKRPRAAIRCISFILHKKEELPLDLAYNSLNDNLFSQEPLKQMDYSDLTELIKYLQNNPKVDNDKLFHIEWSYLKALESSTSFTPKTLEDRMASVPDFFCEIIGICYKSTIEEFNKDQNIEDRRKLAEHAFPLLWKWKTPPGLNPDLSFDIGKFNDWYSKVLEITLATGHAQVANSHVGKVLFYVPKDASGLWMNNDIAKFINENENKTIRESFVSEFYNSRGVFNWSGGEEEKKLADKYTEYAKAVNKKGFLRLAASLRKLAKSYEEDSNREATEDPFDR